MKIFYQYLSTKLIFVCFLAGMLFIHAGVYGQGFAVSGTVSDASGPLPGVNIVIKGTMIGQVSDSNGAFTITVPNADAVLVFTSVGFVAQEFVVGTNRTLNVLMQEDAQTFEEVVVVGYGVQRKVTVTGAVSTMRGEELKASPTTNLSQGIIGRMPGIIGFQRSGQPGDNSVAIRVRGTSSAGFQDPLFIVDGIPDRDGGINRINPDDIESVSVLKDAAAAIYGSRAANGVIIVTTKRGSDGKPSINYSGNWGFQQPTRLPEMCSSFEYATMLNDIDDYRDRARRYTPEELQKFKDGSDPWRYPNTNYYKEAIKNVSPTFRHELSVSGGNDRVRYYTSVNAVGESGIFKDVKFLDKEYKAVNRFDNYGVRTNLDMKVNDYISIAYGMAARVEVYDRPIWGQQDTFSALVRSKPIQHGFYPNGLPAPDIEYGHQPVVMATDIGGYDRMKEYYIQNNLRATIKVPGIEGLTIIPTFAFDKYIRSRKIWRERMPLYQWTGTDEHICTVVLRGDGAESYRQEMIDRTSWMINTVVNYDFTIAKDHNFGLMAGMEGQKKNQLWFDAYRKYYLSTALPELDNGGLDEREARGNSWDESRLNYFGRAQYNFKERYLLELIGRYDGSFRFPKDKRYGFFPGVSVAWRISEESFWNVSAVNYLKIRGSVSQTGSDVLLNSETDRTVNRTQYYLSTYSFGTDYLLGSTFNKTLRPARTANPDITWEKQTEYDLGIELRALKNRLTVEGDVYLRKRNNMLFFRNASLPETSGITLPRENIGKMSNRGVELLLRWDDRAGSNFNYWVAYNMTYSRDKMEFIDEVPNIPDYQKQEGKMWGAELFYIYDGVYKDQAAVDAAKAAGTNWNANVRPGDIAFKDYNGDGKVNSEDRVRLDRRREPIFIGGIQMGASIKGFDAILFFQGAAGGHTYIWRERAGDAGNFYRHTYLNRWTAENPSSVHPRTYNREDEYWASQGDRRSTYYLWRTDYIRLKTAEIGYSFANWGFAKNLNITRLRIYAQGMNLWMIDKVKLQDPDQNDTSREHPQLRSFNFGVALTF